MAMPETSVEIDVELAKRMAEKIRYELGEMGTRNFPQAPNVEPFFLKDAIYEVLEDFRNGRRAIRSNVGAWLDDMEKYIDQTRMADEEAARALSRISRVDNQEGGF
jgi:hypothetical protein